VLLQPGLQLHRGWIPALRELFAADPGACVLCSSLDAREARNDRFVLEAHGLCVTPAVPVANPFAPKNATAPAMARDQSRWSSLLWSPVVAAAHQCSPCLPVNLVDVVLAEQAEGLWRGFWDCYRVGECGSGATASLVCLGDDHWMQADSRDVVFWNRRTPTARVVLRGLQLLHEDVALLSRCKIDAQRTYWGVCVRRCYLAPIYARLCGCPFVTAFDSLEEAAALCLSQGGDLTEEYLRGVMEADMEALLEPNGTLSHFIVRSISTSKDNGELHIRVCNKRTGKCITIKSTEHRLFSAILSF